MSVLHDHRQENTLMLKIRLCNNVTALIELLTTLKFLFFHED